MRVSLWSLHHSESSQLSPTCLLTLNLASEAFHQLSVWECAKICHKIQIMDPMPSFKLKMNSLGSILKVEAKYKAVTAALHTVSPVVGGRCSLDNEKFCISCLFQFLASGAIDYNLWLRMFNCTFLAPRGPCVTDGGCMVTMAPLLPPRLGPSLLTTTLTLRLRSPSGLVTHLSKHFKTLQISALQIQETELVTRRPGVCCTTREKQSCKLSLCLLANQGRDK